MQVESEPKLAGGREVFRVYWQHTKAYSWALGLVLFGTIGMQAADLASPWFLRQFFNTLVVHAPNPDIVHKLSATIVIIAGIALAGWVFRRIQSRTIMYLENLVMSDILATTFSYLMYHSYTFFISRFAGALTHKVSRFAKVYEILLDAIMLQLFPTLLFVIGAVTVLSFQHPSLGISLAVWSIAFVLFQIYVANKRQPLRTLRADEDAKVTGLLADDISNHQTVMLFAGAHFERGLFAAAVKTWRAANLQVWYTDDWIWAGMGLFMIVINIGLLWGAMVLWSRSLLTVGDFVLIQSYLLSTFERLVGINRELRRFYDAIADASEMAGLLKMPHDIPDKKGAHRLEVTHGEIAFTNVTFHFKDDRPVLNQFNLTIKGGEKVALVGPSGAGKSTITKLILRFYDINAGTISVDGKDIAAVQQESLRDRVAFVPQEPILFHRTLMENIRYGRRDATDEEVIEAAKRANCHDFITNQPEGYHAFVGERGIKLSGGERQRVAIARAILKNAPILILDEATSSLDSESESLIQDALERLMDKKTVLVIAHRLSTIMKMDRIVVMEGGSIVAQGTHQELLAQQGLYHKLWNIQAGGFLAEDKELPHEVLHIEGQEDLSDVEEKS